MLFSDQKYDKMEIQKEKQGHKWIVHECFMYSDKKSSVLLFAVGKCSWKMGNFIVLFFFFQIIDE